MKNVLLLGAGSIARRHVESLRSLVPGLRLTVVRRIRELPGFLANIDARLAGDLEEALSTAVDAAVIASPSARHAAQLVPLMERGIPLYVEKPVVTDRRQMERVRVALENYDRPSMVGCNLRCLPSLMRLRERIVDGALGGVVRGTLEAGHWLPDWRPGSDYRVGYSARRDEGGGVLLDLIHEIDMACWLFGTPASAVAWTGRLSGLEIETEDTACLLLAGPGGRPLMTIGLDYVSRSPVRRYAFVGEAGTAEWDLGTRRLVIRGPAGALETVTDRAEDFDVAATYRTCMAEFVNAVAEDRQTSQPLADGLRAVELVLEARERGRQWR